MHYSIVASAAAVLIAIWLLIPFLSALRSPLRSIPGPLTARFSRLWFFRQVYAGTFHQTNIDVHRQYGPIVRVGPDLCSISTPDKSVYGLRSQFPKSDWYEAWKHPSPDRWNLFTDRNIRRHNETRKRFQHLYSMSSLVSYEKYVDECGKLFVKRLSEFAASGETIDMAHWFQCYAFDVIGSITYSKRFGFLDDGNDIAGTMAALQSAMVYSTCVGIYAWLHPSLYSILEKWFPGSGAAARTYILKFVQERIDTRKGERKERRPTLGKQSVETEKGAFNGQAMPEDFLDKMMNAHDEDPEKVTDYHVFMMGQSNIVAGSDTTAVSLSSVLYHLLRFPDTMKKLKDEIRMFENEGRCGKTVITFAESQQMPYLQACLKEALRLHPATGLPLWRTVPDGGAEVQGHYFPAGTTIGLNTWVAHFDESVFGPDAKAFRPERWIEAEKEGGQKFKAMEAYYMPFGLGSRTCIGRHISTLEMSKLIPQIVRSFDFELERPHQLWTTKNYWFVKPVDFNLRVKFSKQEPVI